MLWVLLFFFVSIFTRTTLAYDVGACLIVNVTTPWSECHADRVPVGVCQGLDATARTAFKESLESRNYQRNTIIEKYGPINYGLSINTTDGLDDKLRAERDSFYQLCDATKGKSL
ncbi:uncharacterized protein VTP21DRAFT_971 [Calcarisporiella thermophila]|uniref:uncharacterized protein n=1 Tax=Calcarisporiella thermophila TaxID=911321 RepID=UPI0037443B1F